MLYHAIQYNIMQRHFAKTSKDSPRPKEIKISKVIFAKTSKDFNTKKKDDYKIKKFTKTSKDSDTDLAPPTLKVNVNVNVM